MGNMVKYVLHNRFMRGKLRITHYELIMTRLYDGMFARCVDVPTIMNYALRIMNYLLSIVTKFQ